MLQRLELIFILVVFLPFLICLFRRFLGRGFGKLFTRLASKTEIGIEKKKRLTKRRTLGHFGVIAGHVGTTFFSTPLLWWALCKACVYGPVVCLVIIIMVDSYRERGKRRSGQ